MQKLLLRHMKELVQTYQVLSCIVVRIPRVAGVKLCIAVVISLVLLSTPAMADPTGYGMSFGYGEANPNIDIYRIGLKKDFGTKWFETDVGYASGYFELSYHHWEYGNQDINGVAISPVLSYYFGKESNRIRPYIEGGTGVAYIDEYRIADRNLSTHFQFENRFGVGVRIDSFDVAARYMHYSNASNKEPNHGINIWILSTSIQF